MTREFPDRVINTTSVLHALRHELRPEGSLRERLKTSLVDAQIQAASRSGTNVFVFRNGDQVHTDATRSAFFQKVQNLRRERPVIFFDIPAIEHEKGAPVDRQDLARAFEHAQTNSHDEGNKDEHLLLTVNTFVPVSQDNYRTHTWLHNQLNPLGAVKPYLAVVYPDAYQQETQLLLFGVADRRLHVLVSDDIVPQINRDYMSPWITKVGSQQLLDLHPGRVESLLDNVREVLDPDQTEKIRYLEADYGSGKTTMLQALKNVHIPGVTYVIDQTPLAEQEGVLDGKVIFVDEAVARTEAELRDIKSAVGKNDGVAVLCVPNAEVRRAVEERIAA